MPLRASTTKSEWLPDDPTAFAPSTLWKLPYITTWDDSQSQNRPTNSAEEAIFYTSSFTFLDSSSKTHPPARLRIRLMLKALLGAFDLAEFSGSIREFIESWSRISDADVSPQATEFQLAVASFTPEVLELIVSLTKAAITSPYTKEQYKADISDLGEAIVNILPAVERLGTDGGLEPTSFVSILNAGWYVQLAKLKEFENNRFQAGETPTTEAVRRGLHAIIRKSFELSEIKRRWKEISHVA